MSRSAFSGVPLNQEALEALPPGERKELETLLAQLATQLDANPLNSYIPHPKQAQFHAAHHRTKCFFGGNQSGKTASSIVDDLIQACDRDSLPSHLQTYKKFEPPFYGRIVTPDLGRTLHANIYETLREWCPSDQLRGGNWEKAFDKQNRVLHFKNGSWIDFLSAEMDVDKFSGVRLHRIHFDEEPPGEKGFQIYKESRLRIMRYGGDIVFSMTPLLGLSWVFSEIWEGRGEEVRKDTYERDDLYVVTVDMDDNPHIDAEQKAAALDGMTKEEIQARKEGKFVHFGGLVYDEFSPELHVCDPIEPTHLKGQAVYVGIDPGLKTTAVVFGAFDSDNHLLIFDELYLSEGSAIPENATNAIRDKERRWGIKPSYYIIDPSARNRSLVNAENVQGAYLRAGINTHPGQHKVEAGVFEVKRRLQSVPPLLTIARNCQMLLWERDRYRVKPREDGQFEVVKAEDHACDAMRYLAMSRPLAPQNLPAEQRPQRWQHGTAPAWNGQDVPLETHPYGSFA